MEKRILIVYYSLEGNTRKTIEMLSQYLPVDLLEIKPIEEIKSKGFMKYVWGGRQAVMKVDPDLHDYHCDLSQYEKIILATPVWAFTVSPPIRTFIEENTFRDIDFYLLCTHEGGPGKVVERFKDLINPHRLVATLDIKNPLKDIENTEKLLKKWAKEITES